MMKAMNKGREMRVKGLLILLFVGSCCWANDETLLIKHGAYNNPPWTIQGDTELIGIIPQYVKGIVKRSNKIAMPTQLMSYSRAVLELKKGSIDLTVAPALPSLQKVAEPLVSFGELSLMLYTRKDFNPMTLADFKGKRVAAIRGLNFESHFPTDLDIQWITVNSEAGGVVAVTNGHLDAVICTQVGYEYVMQTKALPLDTLHAPVPLGASPIFGWVLKGRKTNAEFVELKRVIELMAQDGSRDNYLKGVGVNFGFESEE